MRELLPRARRPAAAARRAAIAANAEIYSAAMDALGIPALAGMTVSLTQERVKNLCQQDKKVRACKKGAGCASRPVRFSDPNSLSFIFNWSSSETNVLNVSFSGSFWAFFGHRSFVFNNISASFCKNRIFFYSRLGVFAGLIFQAVSGAVSADLRHFISSRCHQRQMGRESWQTVQEVNGRGSDGRNWTDTTTSCGSLGRARGGNYGPGRLG